MRINKKKLENGIIIERRNSRILFYKHENVYVVTEALNVKTFATYRAARAYLGGIL